MIRLNRVRLINWHNFVDNILDFEKITYLIGVNAVGKTTILDAIRYCLTTNKDFNALGNRKSARTLQGSVHGKQRGENAYTRPGHTVSYIGVEFLDSRLKTSFVITVRVESESPEQEMRHVRQTWYLSPMGIRLENLPYLDTATNTPSSREKFSISAGKMNPIDKQSEARNQICQRLGIGKSDSQLGKKFAYVFPMGTSLDEISDFRTFICEYILPQPVMDVESLQKDEQELENLQETLTLAQQRAQQLGNIVALGADALEKERNARINLGFILFAQYQADSTQQERLFADLETYQDRLQQLQEQYEEARHQADQAHTAYQQAWKALQDSNEGQILDVLRGKARDTEAELRGIQKKVSQCRNARIALTALLPKAAQYYTVNPERHPDAIRLLPQRSQMQALDELETEVKALESALEQAFHRVLDQIRLLESEKEGLEQKIRQLEKGQWFYPDKDRANLVKDRINKAFQAQGSAAEARVLCELLYMNDDRWQDCAEACLGNRRFDILVSPEHYAEAKYVFEQMGEAVGSISLLDSRALYRARSKAPAQDNTLASKVSSENPLAQVYISDLLGRIVCCEESSALENYPDSATRDLLRHYPYRLARLRKQPRYIGMEAKKIQLEEAKKEQRQILKQLQDCKNSRSKLEDLLVQARGAVHGKTVATIREYWNCEAEYQERTKDLLTIQREIRQWENAPLLRGLQAQEQRMKADWERKQEKREDVAALQKTLQEKLEVCRRDILTVQKRTVASLEKWEAFGEDYPQLLGEVEEKFSDAKKRRTPEQIVEYQTNYQKLLEKELDRFVINQLIPAQREFNHAYSCDIPEGIEGIGLFRSQHEQLVQIDLERYGASLQKAKERCRERFRKDILYRMKDDIRNARRQFRELSRIMEKLHYGEESYQFQVRESQEPEKGRICRLIMSEHNGEMTEEASLFNLASSNDPAYEAQIDELVERILSAVREKVEAQKKGKRPDKQMTQWLDYREYLDYDIIITNEKTKESVPLSKVSQDSSGGENQAPFYVAICASLLQIYQKCENSIRLVLLDEAFSKMTSDRIKPMMQMFRQMDLQVLLITTVEKASAIYPMCDVTYSIVKSGYRNAMAPFYLEVENDGV